VLPGTRISLEKHKLSLKQSKHVPAVIVLFSSDFSSSKELLREQEYYDSMDASLQLYVQSVGEFKK